MKLFAPIAVFLVVIIAFFLATTVEADFIKDFLQPSLSHAPQFASGDDQLHLLNDVGFLGVGGQISCFGDFNSDKYTDVFVVSRDNFTQIDVYLWERNTWSFQTEPNAHILHPYPIVNLVAGDFNYDGRLDLLVTALDNQTSYVTNDNRSIPFPTPSYILQFYWGDYHSLHPGSVIMMVSDQVLVADMNGDLKLDLFGSEWIYSEVTLEFQKKRMSWLNRGDGIFQPTLFPGYTNYSISSPHSNAFEDFNGDCLADLFVTSIINGILTYEIWINEKQNGFSLKYTYVPPLGAGQVTFGDFDWDGSIDILFPVCFPQETCATENSIHIIFNKQKGVCSGLKSSSNCRKTSALCEADNNFQFGNVSFAEVIENGDIVKSLTGLEVIVPTSSFEGSRFYYNPKNRVPLIIRAGDYNSDGYLDILVPLISTVSSPNPPSSRVELWVNVPCNDDSCGAASTSSNRRTFIQVVEGQQDLTKIENVYAGAFFDLDENGILDILVNSFGGSLQMGAKNSTYNMSAIFNNYQFDAYFLKAMGLNGVCAAWCPTDEKFPNPKPYGVNQVGVTIKFTVSDLSGATRVTIGSQLGQSAYMALQTPYNLFGLGRTSNYIEQFWLGVTLNQPIHYNNWLGSALPNSQVVGIPYKPDDPTSWTLELYINPSGLMFWITIAIVVTIIVTGALTYFFYRREKKEDEQIKINNAHLFSFNAL